MPDSSTLAYPGAEEPNQCDPLALDDTYVYLNDPRGIIRVAKGGGPVEVIATPAPDGGPYGGDTNEMGGIVVTSSSIYWVVYAYAVMRMGKP